MLTGGELAALVAAVAWAVVAVFLCIALIKLIRLLTEATSAVAELRARTTPLLDDLATTVERANSSLDRVEEITANLASSSEDVSTVTALTRSAVTGPLVKVASLSYGVRQVLGRRKTLALIRTRRRKERV
ncbi:DUF948 domain-containing protein [Thermobifida cellulosilytica]|uniref:DUF948 domain-containing protein n=1 Tax=Thermobifida cellulosilytica TB100 TaxID=665004 RepID=A0A147KFS3_THECS|nr:DUF948 domain-containing protein [Thermobifida cellulosilytica]KUP96132.1 hypothetical protein AC529_13860 [Thermobifida cellulosilytica TB100]